MFFAETSQVMMHRRDVIWHADGKKGCGFLQEAFSGKRECAVGWKRRGKKKEGNIQQKKKKIIKNKLSRVSYYVFGAYSQNSFSGCVAQL